ncbi:MAG: SpoIIE family protein phosphatase, partial [Sphaerochaetaceae bacterium]
MTTSELCTDIGFHSLNKFGEQLCGDHVDCVTCCDGSTLVVLADGLGSGVKASILSTLTAKIISTMMAEGLGIDDCVQTIVSTLPICSERELAYSTFTIMRIAPSNQEADIIQYDNPPVIMIRVGKSVPFPHQSLVIMDKTILSSHVKLQENDCFMLLSDGAVHAGVGMKYNFGWQIEDIAAFVEPLALIGQTAKTLTTTLLEECSRLYDGKPGDDTTVCTIRIRRREPVNLVIGPPANPDDGMRMMSLFFGKLGKHIVCGGTTSSIAAAYLHKSVVPSLDFYDPEVPPISTIEGVDLVTEGVITINKVLEYAHDFLGENKLYSKWGIGRDGASMIARILFEESTDINFYVGRAINPA